ncbi:DUF192 domain-containing protein [Aquimarina sp. 2201CG5-10]|uniref:DUF192 domain-containing protein n=1 Tax=Aquimarina callyspongiae TaxID=3098150 RepID=UPI002AB5748B|nr:DUF192 domain-containing protein [Aquimarina sp. 2201CG5-10]MDY8138575.1 DUF192 domain-containing protein [Aquimarina sp. 2201CG5-10]
MIKNKYPLIIALTAFSIFSCKTDPKNEKLVIQEVTFTKEAELSLFNLKDSIVNPITKLDIEIADDDYQIQTGLMYRKSMQNNQGMLFIFSEETPRSFYMKNTEFALDIIFIDANNKVVSIQKNAKPLDESSLPSEGPAQYVLEVNAKLTDTWNLQKGDSISFSKIK